MHMIRNTWNGLILSVAFALTAGATSAQMLPSGQAVPPGTQNQQKNSSVMGTCGSVDANGVPATATDPSCAGLAPGFANPSTNTPQGGHVPHPVTGVVRIDAVVARPSDAMADVEMSSISNATMVKARTMGLRGCFSAGKQWSSKSGAATSTTCIGQRGDVIAYQECKPKSGDTPMTCTVVMAGQDKGQENAKN